MEKPMKPGQKKDCKKEEKKKGKVKTKLMAKELTEAELDKIQGGIARNGKPS
jgi:bacteriocin-like protein